MGSENTDTPNVDKESELKEIKEDLEKLLYGYEQVEDGKKCMIDAINASGLVQKYFQKMLDKKRIKDFLWLIECNTRKGESVYHYSHIENKFVSDRHHVVCEI